MRYARGNPLILLVIAHLLILGCAPSHPPAPARAPAPPTAGPRSPGPGEAPKTLAIFDFENNAVTDHATYAPLEKGIPAMLTTDLSRSAPSLKLIERSKIASVLRETAFTQMGGVDESTALRAGKLLGAESIAFGSFIVLGDQVRIDTRIIGVETGEVIMAESITGNQDRFMDLVGRLGGKIAESLHARFTPPPGGGGDIEAAVHFSKGVSAWEQGNRGAADRFFQQAVVRDPSYREKIQTLKAEAPAGASTAPAAAPAEASGGGDLPRVKTVEAEGMSFVSRDDAVRQAQRAAVEQAMGVYVRSLTEIEDYEVKKERIFSHSEGYVTRYQILKEMAADGRYIVGIRAQVSMEKIKDDLLAMKILLDSMERPTVMVLLGETLPGSVGMEMDFAETEMVGRFKDRGFDLVDPAQVERIRSVDAARAALEGNAAAAKQLGLRMGAQYVVVGKATVQDIGEAYAGSGLRSLQASLQARVVQTRTGRILGSTVKTAAAAHASPLTGASLAVSKAVRQACEDDLIDAITQSFQDFLNNGAPIKVQVTGVTTFGRSTGVIDLIGGLDRTVHLRKEGWHRTGGLLILDLRFRGTSEELARMIHGKPVEGRSLNVVEVAPDRLSCAVQ